MAGDSATIIQNLNWGVSTVPPWEISWFRSPEAVRRAVREKFGGGRIFVAGDLMLDVYLRGDVARISPEAPVPIVRLLCRSEAPGGAGNVALNLAALGMRVTVAGVVGDDEAGRRLRSLLEKAGVETHPIIACGGRSTVTKTRVIGGHQQMLRIDEETSDPVPEASLDQLLESSAGGQGGASATTGIPGLDDSVAIVVLSDYAKGTLSDRFCQALITAARERAIPVLLDPKGRTFDKYAGATALTPNLHELELATGQGLLDDSALRDAAHRVRSALGLEFLVVTRGERGLILFDEHGMNDFAAAAREVFDVSGAGDTVIATLAAGLAGGLDRDEALKLANVAAGIVVGKVGTAPIERAELLGALAADRLAMPPSKVCDLATLMAHVAAWRAGGERIVFTNGCFDLLHVGHVTLLTRARSEGDRLIVGLNTDRSVHSLKGEGRPVITQDDRAQVLAGLSAVDAVVLFDEPTPLALIESLRPDVLVKGADYSEAQVVGADRVKSWGGKVVLVPLLAGRSTTQILGGGKVPV
jgi:D-beta-D-heptose 7-phosphate kinase/D-beta-D-heptose 1-phosphate adenosyltransferase